jgi:hypothetical protein
MKKRGQFYLSAAVIIIVILAGVFIITNSSSKTRDNELSNLKKELDIEIKKTFEYTINKNLDDNSAKEILNNLSNIYINKTGTKKNSLFIIGDRENLTLKGYRMNESGDFWIDRGLGFENITISLGIFENSFDNISANITIKDNENYYGFKLNQGQSFYYLISKNIGKEKAVVKN